MTTSQNRDMNRCEPSITYPAIHHPSVISSNDKKTPTLRAAPNNNIHLRLQAGEKKKFERVNGGTNKRTKVTLTDDQIIGDLYNQNMALIPLPVSPYGLFGSIFHRFLYGTDAFPLPDLMAKRSISGAVPRGILFHANKLWRLRGQASSSVAVTCVWIQ